MKESKKYFKKIIRRSCCLDEAEIYLDALGCSDDVKHEIHGMLLKHYGW